MPRTLLRIATILLTGAIALGVAGCTSNAPASTLAAGSTATPGGSGHSAGTLTVGGLSRTYRLYVPADATGESPVPLLIALHGGGGSGAHFEQVSGFDRLADSDHFIVAYPDSATPPSGQLTTWNAGGCCGFSARTQVDDIGFLRTLIGRLAAAYPIDPRRVYLDGFSNGGMLAYRGACQLADVVAAVAVQSATLEYAPCDPARPLSLLHLHGTADTEVPLAGGHGQGVSQADFTPPPQAAAAIAAADGCRAGTTDGPDPAQPGAQLQTWSGCPAGITVEFVTIPGATHSGAMQGSAGQVWTFLAAQRL